MGLTREGCQAAVEVGLQEWARWWMPVNGIGL